MTAGKKGKHLVVRMAVSWAGQRGATKVATKAEWRAYVKETRTVDLMVAQMVVLLVAQEELR